MVTSTCSKRGLVEVKDLRAEVQVLVVLTTPGERRIANLEVAANILFGNVKINCLCVQIDGLTNWLFENTESK